MEEAFSLYSEQEKRDVKEGKKKIEDLFHSEKDILEDSLEALYRLSDEYAAQHDYEKMMLAIREICRVSKCLRKLEKSNLKEK